MKWSLLLLSDLHYEEKKDGSVGMRDPKRFNLKKIKELQKTKNLEIVVSAGDMTNYGRNGTSFCGLDKKNNVDEYGEFIREFVNPLENMGLQLLLCPGNHDTYVKWPYINKPVLKYIKKKYKSTYQHIDFYKSNCYKREIHGISFISMGIYPKNLSWLRKNLPIDKSRPIIIFFHYNIIDSEPYSNWWSVVEKIKFYDVIKDFNIKAIFHGHIHATYAKEWRGIPVYNGSSPYGPMLIEFENDMIIDHEQISHD